MTSSNNDNTPHALPLSQRRANPSDSRRAWTIWLQTGGSGVVGGVAFALLLAAVGLLVFASNFHKDQLAEQALQTPLKHGAAVVMDKGITGKNKDPNPRTYLRLQINGTIVLVYITDAQREKWARTQVGQTVTTSYRAGREGIYLIDDWTPPAAKAPISRH